MSGVTVSGGEIEQIDRTCTKHTCCSQCYIRANDSCNPWFAFQEGPFLLPCDEFGTKISFYHARRPKLLVSNSDCLSVHLHKFRVSPHIQWNMIHDIVLYACLCAHKLHMANRTSKFANNNKQDTTLFNMLGTLGFAFGILLANLTSHVIGSYALYAKYSCFFLARARVLCEFCKSCFADDFSRAVLIYVCVTGLKALCCRETSDHLTRSTDFCPTPILSQAVICFSRCKYAHTRELTHWWNGKQATWQCRQQPYISACLPSKTP